MDYNVLKTVKFLPIFEEFPYSPPESYLGFVVSQPFSAYLDYCPHDVRGRYAYVCLNPKTVINNKNGDLFSCLRAAIGDAYKPHDEGLPPFQGGVVGFLGYDSGTGFPKQKSLSSFPDFSLGVYETIAAFDTVLKRAWIISHAVNAKDDIAHYRELLSSAPILAEDKKSVWQETDSSDVDTYKAIVRDAIRRIAAGDLYQVNLSQSYKGTLPSSFNRGTLYQRLRRISPAPYAAFLNCGEDFWLACASPEHFISIDKERLIETRPIKGTARRDPDPIRDAEIAATLRESEKDNAENLMITDLLRNDLGQVATQGSVHVDDLCKLESFANVHHLVSSVRAHLKDGLSAIDVLETAFPGGSITGAPKIMAMNVIAELEQEPRGPFCGSIIALGFDGTLQSSIIIRTIMGEGQNVTVRAGCGIVFESEPEKEYEEAMIKLSPLLRALNDCLA